jgi:FAD/FMN-containing dehydrogenase
LLAVADPDGKWIAPDLSDWSHAYHGANYERLIRIKATYDPDSVFRFHQSLPPATEFAPTEGE